MSQTGQLGRWGSLLVNFSLFAKLCTMCVRACLYVCVCACQMVLICTPIGRMLKISLNVQFSKSINFVYTYVHVHVAQLVYINPHTIIIIILKVWYTLHCVLRALTAMPFRVTRFDSRLRTLRDVFVLRTSARAFGEKNQMAIDVYYIQLHSYCNNYNRSDMRIDSLRNYMYMYVHVMYLLMPTLHVYEHMNIQSCIQKLGLGGLFKMCVSTWSNF